MIGGAHPSTNFVLNVEDRASVRPRRPAFADRGAWRMSAGRILPRQWMIAFILTVALFFLWGVANNLNDILIAHFKAVFTLSDLGAGLVQSAFYFGYFCLAVPAALFMRAQGYRAAVILGLLLYGVGALLFWPAAAMLSYPFFLARCSSSPQDWRSSKPRPIRWWPGLGPKRPRRND